MVSGVEGRISHHGCQVAGDSSGEIFKQKKSWGSNNSPTRKGWTIDFAFRPSRHASPLAINRSCEVHGKYSVRSRPNNVNERWWKDWDWAWGSLQLALRQVESKASGVLDSNNGNCYLHRLLWRVPAEKGEIRSWIAAELLNTELCDEQYLVHADKFKQLALDPDIDIEPVSARPSPMYPSHLTIGPICSFMLCDDILQRGGIDMMCLWLEQADTHRWY